jgi:peptidoglycan/LPS O-acetylase OafA/YrhL
VADARHIALDSWRGIAAVMVACHHFPANSLIGQSALVRNSWLFVDFFFVLSGFIITANYGERIRDAAGAAYFMILRFGRVYPLHLVTLALWVAAETIGALVASGMTTGGRAAFSGAYTLESVPAQLLLLQSIGLGMGGTWNGVAWSISTEFWTYLIFAAALVVFGVQARFVMMALGIGALTFIWATPPGDLFDRWIDLARCIYGFAVGSLVFALYRGLDPTAAKARLGAMGLSALELITVVAVGAYVIGVARFPAHVWSAPIFALAVFAFAFDGGAISRALAMRWATTLGVLSYSIYMLHPFLQFRVLKPVGIGIERVLGVSIFSTATRPDGVTLQIWGTTPLFGDILLIAMLGGVLVVSAASFRWLEEPWRRRIKTAAPRIVGRFEARSTSV